MGLRPVRLGVRTQDSHSCNTGSNPVRAALFSEYIPYLTLFFFLERIISVMEREFLFLQEINFMNNLFGSLDLLYFSIP